MKMCTWFLAHMDEVQRSLCTNLGVGVGIHKFIFLNHLMDLVYIWYNGRYKFNFSIGNILPWPIGHKGKKLGHEVKY